MKSLFTLVLVAILAVSCQNETTESGEIPQTLEAKKALLKEKQASWKALAAEIEKIQSAIEAQDPSAKKRGELVTIQPVTKTDFQRYERLQASVGADDLYDATSEIPARITSLHVKEGQQLKKGQLIATLDTENITKQREEVETALDLAKTVYERQERLWNQKIGSEMQYLQAKNNKERLEKSLNTIDVQLAKNKVYAPVSGVVERLILQGGELASPGMPIVQVLNTSNLKVMADVPENYIRAVKKGDKVEVYIPALDMRKQLNISLLGKTVDPANRTFKLEVKLPNDPLLKPNLLAEVKIKESEFKDVVTIPLETVQQDVSGKRFVFIQTTKDGQTVAQKVAVEIGLSYNNEVIIEKGLKGGEQLIIDGATALADGQLIEIIDNKTK